MAASKKEKPIIDVKHLSKQYHIGVGKTYKTLCESLTSAVKNPSKTLKDCRRPNETFWALKDVNFEVERGEAVGIIGRNGAGKSTLLKILSRITYPTEGEIRMRGRVGSLLEVGTGFHPELTGRENIYFNGAILGMKKREIDEKFDEIVNFSGVEKFLDTPVKRYSSGMQVRLAFSVAANLDPEILVVDEVLAVGDAAFQKKCMGKMSEVAEGGRTVLFVSHNIGAIKQLCSQAILLRNGMIESQGDVEKMVNIYLDELSDIKSEYEWTDNHPGDSSVVLNSIRLCKNNGNTSSSFGSDEIINTEVDYTILNNMPMFRIGFALHSFDGTYIFYTSDDDEPIYSGKSRTVGRYISRCKVPSNWLNEGSYYVSVSGEIFGEKVILKGLPKLAFTVNSTGGPTNRFNEKRRGILCPSLRWDIVNLN